VKLKGDCETGMETRRCKHKRGRNNDCKKEKLERLGAEHFKVVLRADSVPSCVLSRIWNRFYAVFFYFSYRDPVKKMNVSSPCSPHRE